MNGLVRTWKGEIVLLNVITYTVAVFWDFQFFPDTLPLLEGAKRAIEASEVLDTVSGSPIVEFGISF